MNQNDYYITFDEKGAPYIEHGFFDNVKNTVKNVANKVTSTVSNAAKGVGRGVRQNHKYLLKVFENGKTRYFYKQSEVDAYYRAKKAGIKNAAEYVQNKAKNAGASAKDMINKAKETVKSTADKVTGASANKNVETAKKNADDASRWAKMTERVHKENMDAFKQNPTEANLARAKQSGQAVTKANQNVKNAKAAVDDAKTKATSHPVNKAKDMAEKAKASVKDAVGYDEREHARQARSEANLEYEKAPTSNKAREAIAKATGAEDAYNKTLLGKAEKVTSSAKEMVDKAKTAVKDTAKDIAGYDERERRDAAKQVTDSKRAEGRIPTIMENTRTAQTQKAYNKTPLGMIENAKNAISSAKDMVDKAKSTEKASSSSAKDMVDQAEDSVRNKPVSIMPAPTEKVSSSAKDMVDKEKSAEQEQYVKKPDPVNSSGARPYETMKRDAREAGVDFAAYDKAASDAEKLAKRLMKEYREANESPGPKSLVGKMWYTDPEYKRAIEKRNTEEEKLVKQLYQ